jgi:hypothetical protein
VNTLPTITTNTLEEKFSKNAIDVNDLMSSGHSTLQNALWAHMVSLQLVLTYNYLDQYIIG